MAKRHMKKCSASLIIRQMQIKSPMRYHFEMVSTAIIKTSTNSKCQGWCRENENPHNVCGKQYSGSLKD